MTLPNADASGSLSAAVQVGDLVFTSGQVAVDAESGELVEGPIALQTEIAITRLAEVLAAAGASLRDVVKVTAHLSSFELFEDFDRAYVRRFDEPRPARTTVESGLGGVAVELDAIAVVGSGGPSEGS